MGLVYTATLGLIIWLVMWAIGFKAFDSFLVFVGLAVLGIAGRMLLPYLPGRQNL